MARDEALSSLEQAEFFYRSAVGVREWAAKPLPLYYSFMNLAKAFALTQGVRTTFDRAQHGVSEQLPPGGKELQDASLEVHPSPGNRGPNLFADFGAALGASPIATKTSYQVPLLLPQIVPGHRIWCDAAGADERFFAIDSIPFNHSATPKQLWATFRILEDDLDRVGKTRKELLKETRLKGAFREIEGCDDNVSGKFAVQLEQIAPMPYSGRTADKLAALVATLRPYIWSTVTSIRPFRRYYLYASPVAEHASLLPQALSIYAIAYYLGSITRYRPQHFARILAGSFGEFIQEFLTSQPSQFVYLMASDFAKRDVARAPLV
ncbi:MAG: hypothetical protein IT182_10010 [Acidobacteria bacterium]|nr:hypothetical protein [Acidobacteriota bacterium]